MKKYVDAKSVLNEIERWALFVKDDILVARLMQCIRNLPAEDVAPVKRGEWVKMDMHKGMEQYKCSVCHSECYVPECMGEPMYNFCPNCGARMDGDADE